jgi:hypothetical protein
VLTEEEKEQVIHVATDTDKIETFFIEDTTLSGEEVRKPRQKGG